MSSNSIDSASETAAAPASKKSVWIQRGILVAAILALVAVYFLVPAVHEWVGSVFAMFATGDFSAASDFMAQYGPAAAVVSFLLMVFQSVIAPLPAFLITIANANLFGWWQGAILSWTSAMAGAALCFWIARVVGREAVEKLAGKNGIRQMEEFFQRHGTQSVLIARLLPFVSFDWVSYFAGLTSMRFWSFFLATGLGQLPATIVYSYVGGMLTGGAKLLMTGLLILFALAILVVVVRQVYTETQKKKGAAQAAAPAEQADGSATQVAAPAEQATATAAPVEQATAAATQVATPVEQVTAVAPAGQAAASAAQATAPARQD
ncbi:MAG: TVP38/TMEM64 family protein [Coriobacteriales bacterium]|nr:TVP38/TMEM64 family protein [Coriobacteriales bacterium]